MKKSILLLGLCLVSLSNYAAAKTLYVDEQISSSCSNYSVQSRSCGSGNNAGYKSFSSALSAASAGDEIVLRGGQYSTLYINKSGNASAPITIKGHENETATITGSDVGFKVIDSSYITIKDLTVDDALGFGRLQDSQYITIENVTFNDAGSSGTTGGLKFVRSTNSKVLNSRFNDGSDLVIFQDDSNYNIFSGNDLTVASHSLLSIRCSSYNIIRNNRFGNSIQKSVEIYDCEGVSDAPVRLDDTKRNLIEDNEFYLTRSSSAPHRYNAIQHAGQQGVTRRNIFYNNAGGAVRYQHYSDEALHNYQNRLYHNTFYNNNCYAFSTENYISGEYYGHEVVNNAFYNNTDCDGDGSQIDIPDSKAVKLRGNYNSTTDPKFTSVGSADFTPQTDSPLVDAGEHLTQTTSSGSGKVIPVVDASYFVDGFGIAGETGDVIRIASTGATATVVSVDLNNNQLTLNKSVTWANGDGVSLNYNGSKPDIGAIEVGGELAAPNPPKNVKATQVQ